MRMLLIIPLTACLFGCVQAAERPSTPVAIYFSGGHDNLDAQCKRIGLASDYTMDWKQLSYISPNAQPFADLRLKVLQLGGDSFYVTKIDVWSGETHGIVYHCGDVNG